MLSFIYFNTQQYVSKSVEKLNLAPAYDICTSLSIFIEEINSNSYKSCNGFKNE